MKTDHKFIPTTTVINENYVSDNPPPLKKTNSAKNMIKNMPEVNFPTKKFRMRSLLWVKPTGVAVSSTSSLLAQVSINFNRNKFA